IIRPCRSDEFGVIGEIINDAAQAYQGVIPEDRWHEPCMSLAELKEQMERRLWGSADKRCALQICYAFCQIGSRRRFRKQQYHRPAYVSHSFVGSQPIVGEIDCPIIDERSEEH